MHLINIRHSLFIAFFVLSLFSPLSYAAIGVTDFKFGQVEGIAINSKGHLFVSDSKECVIYKLVPTYWHNVWMRTVFAGDYGSCGVQIDGKGRAARFKRPQKMAIDSADNLYLIDDELSHTIVKITPSADATALSFIDMDYDSRPFDFFSAIAVDHSDFLYIADGQIIRRVNLMSNEMNRFAGDPDCRDYQEGMRNKVCFSGANSDTRPLETTFIRAMTFDDNNELYLSLGNGARVISKISSSGFVSTYSGKPFTPGKNDADAKLSKLSDPEGLFYSNHTLYIADAKSPSDDLSIQGSTIRSVQTEMSLMRTIAGSNTDVGYKDSTLNDSLFGAYLGDLVVSLTDQIFVTDISNNNIRVIDSAKNEVSTLKGFAIP